MVLDEPKEDEQPVQVNGIDILVAEMVKPLVDNLTVDYITSPHNDGFIIKGSKSSC